MHAMYKVSYDLVCTALVVNHENTLWRVACKRVSKMQAHMTRTCRKSCLCLIHHGGRLIYPCEKDDVIVHWASQAVKYIRQASTANTTLEEDTL